MIRAAGALLSLALSSASPPVTAPEPLSYYPQVKQVICDRGRGSAFRVSTDTFVTAAHVATASGCMINGEPIDVAELSGPLDFAVLKTRDIKQGGLQISCEGFKAGDWYYATGYALGWPLQRTILVRATLHKHDSGLTVLSGPEIFIPGMSGGTVTSAVTGKVVGVVNAILPFHRVSLSRSLKDTSLCSNA